MKILRLLPALALVAACAPAEPNKTRTIGGTTQIQIKSGNNCYDDQCFNYDAKRQIVAVIGRKPAKVPDNISVGDGYVTAAEFAAMFDTAQRAEVIRRISD